MCKLFSHLFVIFIIIVSIKNSIYVKSKQCKPFIFWRSEIKIRSNRVNEQHVPDEHNSTNSILSLIIGRIPSSWWWWWTPFWNTRLNSQSLCKAMLRTKMSVFAFKERTRNSRRHSKRLVHSRSSKFPFEYLSNHCGFPYLICVNNIWIIRNKIIIIRNCCSSYTPLPSSVPHRTQVNDSQSRSLCRRVRRKSQPMAKQSK